MCTRLTHEYEYVPQIVIDVIVKEEDEDSDLPFDGWPAQEDQGTRPAGGGEEGGDRAADGTFRAAVTDRDLLTEEYIEKVGGKFVCQVCDEAIKKKRESNLRNHVEDLHLKGTYYMYTCDICSAELPSKTGYHNGFDNFAHLRILGVSVNKQDQRAGRCPP